MAIKFEDIPTSLRQQYFPSTGGTWQIHEGHIIEITLGPKVDDRFQVEAEAHWAEDLFAQVKSLDTEQQWDAITNLENLPKQDNPPLEMRITYGRMIKDQQTRRVAIVHATGFNKAVTEAFIITVGSKNKVRFFSTIDEAKRWLVA